MSRAPKPTVGMPDALVGRQAELDELEAGVAGALAGRGVSGGAREAAT